MKSSNIVAIATVQSLIMSLPTWGQTPQSNFVMTETSLTSQVWSPVNSSPYLFPCSKIIVSEDCSLQLHIAQDQKLLTQSEDNSDDWRFELQPTLLIPFRLRGEVVLDGLFTLERLENINIGDTNISELLPPNISIDPRETLGNLLSGERSFNSITYDLDLDDIANLDAVLRLSGRFRAIKGPLALIVDGQYTRVKTSGEITLEDIAIQTPNGNIELDAEINIDNEIKLKMGFFDVASSYRVIDTGKDKETKQYPNLFLEPIGGIRVGFLDLDLEISPGPDFRADEFFVEPLVGALLGVEVSPDITLGIRGDLSGFGIGINPSDLTWNVLAGLDWRMSETFSLRVAYRIQELDIDGELESSSNVISDDSEYDLFNQEQGIWLGFTFLLN